MLNKSRRGNVMKMGAGAAQANSEKQAMRAVATATRMAAETGADDAAALKKLAKQAGEAAQLLKLLGNEKRLLVLCFLAARGEMTVGELVGVAKLSQSALSQHLARLRADGLVTFRRTSQTLHYRIADKRALRIIQVLKEIYCGTIK
ncbi:DNA-binding transcriptional regulator, ArsR family [Bradyrhizobium erythrophlei]|jgi:DNA-binding transcriptional ArsR family regulator|uniref:DNA-binding transcriptional regulator, ArsR family n=2 Tax=Bradyrhizobium erythrophlei TaxID=1437360 RepID=A0A1M5K805_9BRAD|nr:DNA-binding transcriptional regulator, ArsR family [Bradyrhizobium erythrophlei]